MTETTKLPLFRTRLPYLDSAEVFDLVADESWAIFMDSGTGDENRDGSARFDVLAISPQATLMFDGNATQFNNGKVDQRLFGDPLSILQTAIPECDGFRKSAYLPGAYGYFSYDLARQYEVLPSLANDPEGLPQMAMGIYHVILVVDHKHRVSRLLRIGDSQDVIEVEQRWLALVLEAQERQVDREIENIDAEKITSEEWSKRYSMHGQYTKESLGWDEYQLAFARIRQYTKGGDCYQVNLTKQFSSDVDDNSWRAYTQLRHDSPAPYGCYMNLPFAQILSNSPESFIQCRNRKVTTSPIKGTRPRYPDDPIRDKQSAKELLHSEKDKAENLMIVDLMRNDLGRACELGSINVPQLFALHSFANVHHLISTVVGKLRKELHVLDLLRTSLPGGSVTGAPKIRSMQIIEELEPVRRGLYCGSIGYVGADGSLETNIAIRTIVVKDGVARYSAGGGLVIDSDVQEEYQELNDKAKMMRATVLENPEKS